MLGKGEVSGTTFAGCDRVVQGMAGAALSAENIVRFRFMRRLCPGLLGKVRKPASCIDLVPKTIFIRPFQSGTARGTNDSNAAKAAARTRPPYPPRAGHRIRRM